MKYKINLLSDWHCGSGLSAGVESDAEVLKDDSNLPYIPGKTIKGLLKDALMEMPEHYAPRDMVGKLFGREEKDKDGMVIRTHKGSLFFSNATLCAEEQEEVVPELAEFLYRNISSTTINENGVAKPKTLRTMEVCIPISLVGEIAGIENEEEKTLIKKAIQWVRHLGVNRNRGLGRCQFIIDETIES